MLACSSSHGILKNSHHQLILSWIFSSFSSPIPLASLSLSLFFSFSLLLSASTPLFTAMWNFPSTESAAVLGSEWWRNVRWKGRRKKAEWTLLNLHHQKPGPLWWRFLCFIFLLEFSGKIPDRHKVTETAEMEDSEVDVPESVVL